MKVKILSLLCIVLLSQFSFGQSIKGQLSLMPNQEIKLLGFKNFETYPIDSTKTNEKGVFELKFSKTDYGMAQLKPGVGDMMYLVTLSKNDIKLKGETLGSPESIEVMAGVENQRFVTYFKAHSKREQALSAWLFLERMYTGDSLFMAQDEPKMDIIKEIARLKSQDNNFIKDLPKDSYMKWYLPLRSLLSSVGVVAQQRTQQTPETLKALRQIDYTDDRLYKSGLLYDAIFNHIWFIENSSGGLDLVFKDLNKSIDIIIEQLKDKSGKFNTVTAKMFDVLEERSLFTSSEYLSEKLLNGDDCGCLNPQLQKKLERYGKMAKGQTAPNIEFGEFTYYPKDIKPKTLKDIDSPYKLVVFAAGWCPHCTEVLPKIAEHYNEWKAKGLEVVLVSLDENASDFAKFAAPMPFISTTDYQKWKSVSVKEYQVYATPTYFLLDKELEIILRPKSVEHVDSWLNWSLNDKQN